MWNILYQTSKGSKLYCLTWMTFPEACLVLRQFKERYLNADGTGKLMPNGHAYYDIYNPRLIKKEEGKYYV